METIAIILDVLAKTIGIYLFLLFIRVMLTWFPNIDMSNPILLNLSAITDPYLNFFRGIIPPLGGLDLSPILGFILLNVLQDLISRAEMQFFFAAAS